MRAFCAFFLGGLALVGTAEARIGETTEESIKRYGQEKTLLEIKKRVDATEVSLAEEKKAFTDLKYPAGEKPSILEIMPNDRELAKRYEIKNMKYLAVRSAQYDRFREIKDDYRAMEAKGKYEQSILVHKNKARYAEFFGDRIESFESLGSAIKSLDWNISWAEKLTRSDLRDECEEVIKTVFQVAKNIESLSAKLESLKRQEEEFSKAISDPNCEKRLKFFVEGFWIVCYLKDDYTYKILYLREEISNEDVQRILLNNADQGVTWSSVVIKKDIIDETELLPLVRYQSSDGKLGAVFAKIIKDKNDLGQMRGVLIFDRSAVASHEPIKNDTGI